MMRTLLTLSFVLAMCLVGCEAPAESGASHTADFAAAPLGSPDNPVRCDMPAGERAYLDRLRCPNGLPPTYRRIGSFGAGPHGNIMNGYRVHCPDAEPNDEGVVIFTDMYHQGYIENEAVPGFTIAPLE